MSSRRVVAEFFARAEAAAVSRPQTTLPPPQPLSRTELEKLGRLAGIDVSSKSDAAFAQSVAQVLDFCSSVGRDERNLAPANRLHDRPVAVTRDQFFAQPEQVREGNIASQLLANAKSAREGYFTAPRANKMED